MIGRRYRDLPVAQYVRLFDVFILGPVMVRIGKSAEGIDANTKKLLELSGYATILYNGLNFVRRLRSR